MEIYSERNEFSLFVFCCVFTVVIFAVDLSIPLGVAVGVPYALVVLLSARFSKTILVSSFALTGTILTLLGYFLSEPGGVTWMVISNRVLAILAIWLTAYLAIRLKKQAHQVQLQKGLLQGILETSSIMLWRTDLLGQWIYCSNGWLQFTGRTLQQEFHSGWLTSLHQDDRAMVQQSYDQMVKNELHFQLECRILSANNEYHWILLQGAPNYIKPENLDGFIVTALDIQQKKETELTLETTRQRYYQREKMASIGIMVSGVLHEVGNPLASISGLMQAIGYINGSKILSDKDREQINTNLQLASLEMDRLSRITNDFGDFASIPTESNQPLNLNDLIDRTYRLMKHDERMWQIDFRLDLDSAIPAVKMTADHFVQVLQNLIGNALDACDDIDRVGEIVLKSGFSDARVFVEVIDNGVGMSEDVLIRANQEFFTTKKSGKGMGLGLSLCKTLIEENSGILVIHSQQGVGTKFVITYPTYQS